jgi:transcriptional regulator with XRE-family HTH domain
VAGGTLRGVDAEGEINEFLRSRRARLTPGAVGLPTTYGRQRRVPGLRREEVAMLAGVSVDYYNRLERGQIAGASYEVLDGIARALRLDDAERTHLFDLVRAVHGTAPRRFRRTGPPVRPSVQWMLDAMNGSPAFLRNRRLDILAASPLGRALYSVMYDAPERPVNICRFLFLDPRGRDLFVDWDASAAQCVAVLHAHAGQDPHDRELSDLVGELSTRSEAFRTRWAGHNVRFHDTGVKRLRHPVVGELNLAFNRLEVSADPGYTVLAYAAQPGSPDEQALKLLASWAATPDARASKATPGA